VATGDGPPAFLPARPITQPDLAALTKKLRRRVVCWFRMQRLLDAAAAADMIARENGGFSVDASVRITLFRLQLRVYCQPLEHLLRYCARPSLAEVPLADRSLATEATMEPSATVSRNQGAKITG
jgi:hypothetical protein